MLEIMVAPLERLVGTELEIVFFEVRRIDQQPHLVDGVAVVDGIEAVAELVYAGGKTGEEAVAVQDTMPYILLVRADRIVLYMPIGG